MLEFLADVADVIRNDLSHASSPERLVEMTEDAREALRAGITGNEWYGFDVVDDYWPHGW